VNPSGGRVVVMGAINVDLVVEVPHLPRAGETVLGGSLVRHGGGKGANQAVAAARAGAQVFLVGAVGDDPEGDASLAELSAEGIDVGHVARAAAATGVALIAVDRRGENQIIVAPGANATIDPASMPKLAAGDVLLVSLEIPLEAVAVAGRTAASAGARLIVNPAPAAPLPTEVHNARPILVPNAAELLAVAGSDDPDHALATLLRAGASAIVVTRGAGGALLVDDGMRVEVPAHRVAEVVDTTGAGDAFCGAFAAWLAGGATMADAVRAATVAGGLSVTAAGARAGMPTRRTIEHVLADAPR